MNKALIGISILLGSILIVENMVMGTSAQILIWYGTTGTLSIFAIIIGIIGGFGLKGLISEKGGNEYDNTNDGINF